MLPRAHIRTHAHMHTYTNALAQVVGCLIYSVLCRLNTPSLCFPRPASPFSFAHSLFFLQAGFLDFKIQAWQRMLVTRLVALGPAVAVAVLAAGHPTVTDVINEWYACCDDHILLYAVSNHGRSG